MSARRTPPRPRRRRRCGHTSAIAARENAAIAALGAQYVGFWWDARTRAGPSRSAPGALDVETGKAAIQAELAARFAPEAAALLSSTLAVYPTLYSGAELVEAAHRRRCDRGEPARRDRRPRHRLPRHGRLRVMADSPLRRHPENVARVQALIGQYGDKVRRHVRRSGSCPWPASPRRPRPSNARPVRDAAEGGTAACAARRSASARRTTRRCARSRSRPASAASPPSAGKRARLALKSRSTRVHAHRELRDGRTATQTFTYRRCG